MEKEQKPENSAEAPPPEKQPEEEKKAEQKPKKDQKYEEAEGLPKHSAHDDAVIADLSNQQIKLKPTDVRKRQNTCTFSQVKKDELPSFAPDFKPARRLTLNQMLGKDKHDPSLENYKKQLLGDIDEEEVKMNEAPEVEIIKVEVVCDGRPGGNIILDFTQQKNEVNKKQTYQIKENAIYHLRIHFKVRFDCVYGLKFVNNVWKHFLKVDKSEEMMGSFAPKKQIQTFDLVAEQAPEGFFSRGTYKGKAMFLDNDGIVHMQYEYKLIIDKDWK